MKIEVDGAYSGIRFSACHFIPGHEKCGRLHGHSYIVRLAVEGDIGSNGMVMDFGSMKKAMRDIVEELDHRVLLPAHSKEVRITSRGDVYELDSLGKKYMFPQEDVILLDIENTTAEEMSLMMVNRLADSVEFPPNVKEVFIGLDEERGQTAWASRRIRE